MNKTELQEFHDAIIGGHRSFYKADPQAQLQTMLFVRAGSGETAMVVGGWDNDMERETFILSAKMMLKSMNASAYVIASEAWCGTQAGVRPSKQDGKTEVVVTAAVTRDGDVVGSILPIDRDWTSGDKILGDDLLTDGGLSIQGALTGLFDE